MLHSSSFSSFGTVAEVTVFLDILVPCLYLKLDIMDVAHGMAR